MNALVSFSYYPRSGCDNITFWPQCAPDSLQVTCSSSRGDILFHPKGGWVRPTSSWVTEVQKFKLILPT
jgi:hypothetical protein